LLRQCITQADIFKPEVGAVFYPAIEAIAALAAALIIWYGGGSVLRNTLTLGALVAFLQYSQRFFRPISDMSEKFNVLQSAMRSGVRRVIQTSTSEVYGTARTIPISEDHPLQGQSPYSASKIGSDKIAESFYLSFGFPVVIVRPFNTFGPRQSARAVIPTIVTQALRESEIHLGNLEPTRDLNYIADTVEGFVKAAESEHAIGEVINLGNGKEISIGKLAEKILSMMGKTMPIVCEDRRIRPGDSEVERLCADNRKAREILGWEPAHTLEEGLNNTIAWMRENNEQYRSNAYVV
jgi:dTDP-glucose 4,6-dehydratase